MFNTMLTQFASEAAEKEGIAVLGIDLKAILLQAGTFVLLYLIIKKFALRGIVDTLEKRRKTIDKGVSLGLEMQHAKAGFDKELKDMRHKARVEADKILATAHQEAGEIIKAGEASAAVKVDGILKDASARIEREMQTARKELRNEMLSLVSEATEVIISEKLDAKKDASLIERALSRVRA
ncbi:MAG: F-type H+-transporting ATPase subunit b [Patescibacteria group bacterium]|nr:F-type H+-transporting ATPase subunit b [Patescibacteria group bacterium]